MTISLYDQELNILFGAMCDGLRQEVRYRYLAQLIAPKDVILLAEEREAQLVNSLAFHVRTSGFLVHVESYYYDPAPPEIRPDLAIRLPATGRYIFIEVKPISPQGGFQSSFDDIEKLMDRSEPKNKRTGFVAAGFRNKITRSDQYEGKYHRLSQEITSRYPFRKIGIERIELPYMEDRLAQYAMLGFWVRK